MASIRILPRARLDVLRIDYYLRSIDENLASRFRRAFRHATARYASRPFLGSPYDYAPPDNPDLRYAAPIRFPNYLILYRPKDFGIEVVRVVHSSQDPARLFNDDP